MAVKSLYLKGGTLQNGFQPMQEDGVAPTDAAFATATGWIVATLGAGNQSGFRANTEQAAAQFSANAQPFTEGLVTGANANAFRAGPFSGTFAAGDWTFSTILRSVTAAMGTGQTGRLRWELFYGSNADGSGATRYTTAVGVYTYTPSGGAQTTGTNLLTNTVAGTGNTTANQLARVVTWAAPALTFSNQYLFFANAYEIIATGGTGATRDANFRENSASAITTTDFVPATPSLLMTVNVRTMSLIRR